MQVNETGSAVSVSFFARLRRASDSHHAGTGMLCCHAVWRCPSSTAGGYAKQVHQWVTHMQPDSHYFPYTQICLSRTCFARNTIMYWENQANKQMLHNIRNELTTLETLEIIESEETAFDLWIVFVHCLNLQMFHASQLTATDNFGRHNCFC